MTKPAEKITAHRSSRPIALALAGLLLLAQAAQALDAQAGLRRLSVRGSAPDAAPIPVALYYPTQAPASAIPMGPFTVRVAVNSPPDAQFKGLIILSHGTGGTELGHTSLAEGLAQRGYLVAALRHPGDNWQDRSLLQSAGGYFKARPQHVSGVIDELLRDPEWGGRIAKDAQGPRIGAVGHSAGAYTVLALAGAQPDLARLATHCEQNRADDPIFCGLSRQTGPASSPVPAPIPALVDTRVRAVVVLAPVGAVFSAESLAKVRIPIAIYVAERDRFLVSRFHAEWIARNLPGAELHKVPNAWHFAFMDTPGMPIPSEDGDIGANPPGFDRQALLEQLKRDLPLFFDKALR
jgi:predicted dienelactone hydrolase